MVVGAIKQLEVSFWNEVDSIQAKIDKELLPIRQEIDKGINQFSEILAEQIGRNNAVGIGIVDAGIDLFRSAQVKTALTGLFSTIFRVACVAIGVLVVTNPLVQALSTLAIFAHAIYKGLVAMEESEMVEDPSNEILNKGVKAFICQGFLNPLSLSIDRTVEELVKTAHDLYEAKQFFILLGQGFGL